MSEPTGVHAVSVLVDVGPVAAAAAGVRRRASEPGAATQVARTLAEAVLYLLHALHANAEAETRSLDVRWRCAESIDHAAAWAS